jgi:oligogalacturonide lyase
VARYDWVTHESVITPDEVAFVLLGHREAGHRRRVETSRHAGAWLARPKLAAGSGMCMVLPGRALGSGRRLCPRSLYLIDRRPDELMLLSTGHKVTAADHTHPTFSPDKQEDRNPIEHGISRCSQ